MSDEATSIQDEFEAADLPLWPYALKISDPALQPLWLRWLNIVLQVASAVSQYITVVCFAVVLAIVFIGVFFRYVLNSPLTWAESLAMWFLIWMSFAGAPFPLQRGTHFMVEAFVKGVPRSAQLAVAIVTNLLVLAFCVILFWTGVSLTIQNLKATAPALDMPYAIPYASIPFGFSLMSLIVVRDLAELLLNFRPKRS